MRGPSVRVPLACFAAALLLVLFLPRSDLAAPRRAPADSASAIARGNNAFAFDLYSGLRTPPGNLFLSPFSIETAMSMVFAGARGATAQQMSAALHLPGDAHEAQAGFADLLGALQSSAKTHGYQLDTANGLWAQKDYPLLPAYRQAMGSAYSAEIESVDFVHEAQAIAARINSWVAQRTQDKIKDLFAPSAFSPNTRLVLANAIYFKGSWARVFKPQMTQEDTFIAPGGAKIQVHMMQQQGSFKYFDAGSYQLLELPYRGDTLAMDVFLPRKPDGLPAFEQDLTADKVAGSLTKLGPAMIRVELPRFTMSSSFELNHELAALGMRLAFSRGADFSGMSERGRELSISTVVHKAYVDVNEQGTEAAAATGIGIVSTAVMRYTSFRVDHPCFFLIRDLSSGAILFMGRLDHPSPG
ncbi:MAG TPA: serpin family protein [Candidatus Acidoferrales bacterium]|nr:serpin family protein [Candidatus Acidoferrales bacterium]